MEWLLRLMASVAIVSTARPVLQARIVTGTTTLLEAWRWGVVALSVWCGTWFITELAPIVRGGMADQLWLASAILMVSPLVAALGARRPGSRVWSWFVVLPVIIVLFLPAVTAWNRDLRPTDLRLEVPMLIGYGLVLLMGAGNYLGTRFAVPALLVAAACLIVVWPMSQLADRLPLQRSTANATASIVLSTAAWLGAWQAGRSTHSRRSAIDRVWNDFRDFFGVVWGRRLMDRINDTARQEGWSVQMHFDGLVQIDASKPADLSPEQLERVDQALRWLLRRFVDPEWIDERLKGDG
jgi:hypothetical protein